MFDIGFGNIALGITLTFGIAMVLDFLLSTFSQRFSLCTGGFQTWCLDRMGQGSWTDGLLAIILQFVSLRRRAFFGQAIGFINVGSFSKSQILLLAMGGFVGGGLALALFFVTIELWIAIPLMVGGFFFRLLPEDRFADFGVACLALGAAIALIFGFDVFLQSQNLPSFPVTLSWFFIALTIVLSSLLFETQLPVVFVVAFYVFFNQIPLANLPWIFALHGLCYSVFLGRSLFGGRKRLHFFALWLLVVPVVQAVTYKLALDFELSDFSGNLLTNLLGLSAESSGYLFSFFVVLLCFACFQAAALILIPIIVLIERGLVFPAPAKVKNESQKILPAQHHRDVFSLHFSLQLLRQEFVKMATLFHTVLKFGREAHEEAKEVTYRLRKYTFVLERVGYELKELCFSVGSQRAYRQQITEILNYYKLVNHIELMMADLSEVIECLQSKEVDEEIEKECRLWLSLQLKLFEDFYGQLVDIPMDDSEGRVDGLAQKSYESIDRLVRSGGQSEVAQGLSKALHRVTDSNVALCRLTPSESL